MKVKNRPVITAIHCITPVGGSAEMTAASVRTGISRLEVSDHFVDEDHNYVKVACIEEGEDTENGGGAMMDRIAQKSLAGCLSQWAQGGPLPETVHLLVGLPPEKRPGISVDLSGLARQISSWGCEVLTESFPMGNASAIYALERAAQILEEKPETLCIAGAIDSLLEPEILGWLGDLDRLIVEGAENSQGFSPSQAAAFFSVESVQAARDRGRLPLAGITGLRTAREPAPFVSNLPSKGEGVTAAVRGALEMAPSEAAAIDWVLCDLNGEFHRSKEWGFADVRCFGNCNPSRQLLHPADCMGDSGAASAGVLLVVAAEGVHKGWLGNQVLVSSSDDHGACGAVVLSALGSR